MATSIGPKIGVDGEAEYRAQMTRLISKTKALKAEEEALKTAVGDEATEQDNAKKAAQKHTEQIETQKQKIELLQTQLDKCKTATGENSTETNKYREALAKAQTELAKLEGSTDDSTDALDDFAESEEDAGEGALSLGDMISANLISEAIIGGLKMLANLAKEAAEALLGAARDAAEYADEVMTMSTVTGLSTDQIQEMQYMAELVDVSLDTMTGSMTKLTRTMVAARKGGEGATDAFRKLGVRTTNADGSLRNANDVFFDVIDALGQMEDGTERDALAMEVFGKSAQDLNPLIAAGRDSIEAFKKEAHDMGYVLDEETLDKLGALDDSFVRLDNLRTTLRNKMGAAMAPAMERVINKLIEFADRVDWDKIGAGLGRLLETGADKLIELLDGLDFEKLASGAATLLDGLVNGLTWILEHADEIVSLVSKIGGMLLLGKGAGMVGDAAGMFKNFFSGWGSKAAGGAAGAGGAGAGVSAASVGMGAAITLPASILAALGMGILDRRKAVKGAQAEAALGEGMTVEEYEANVARWKAALEEANKAAAEADANQFDDTEGKLAGALNAQAAAAAGLKVAEAELAAAQAAAGTAADGVETTLGGMSAEAQAWGADMMTSFASGLSAGYNGSVLPTALTIAAGLAGLFAHSEPKIGPLSNDSTWMPDMMESFATGIRDNRGLVLDEMNALASDMAGSMSGGGGTTMNYGGVTVVFQVQDGQDGRALFEQFSDWLAQSVYREGADLA